MTINDVLFFDTETTGIPDRSAKWDVDFNDYPHIVQIAWIYGKTAESYIIRPDGWEIPEETVAVHGITTEYAMEHGQPFVFVIDRFIAFAQKAGLLCGHNIHFDTGIIKANILRELGHEYFDANGVDQALFKGKRIDTMRPTMKWVDARMANGRLKFPNLSELYARCFPGEKFPAHDALSDTAAVARCLPVILELGLVELKVKEYPEEQPNNPVSAFAKIADAASDAAKIAADAAKKFAQSQPAPNFPLGGIVPETAENGQISAEKQKDDKLPIQPEKAPQIENLTKITDAAADLLDQNDF